MSDHDEIWRGVLGVDPARRGFDGGRAEFGDPYTECLVVDRPDRLAVVFLNAIADLAGFGAAWQWDFASAKCREEFERLVDELSEGAGALRGVLDDIREQHD